MKVVQRKRTKALKGDKSRSFQVITPGNVGARKFMITVVEVHPGGSTPAHEHRTSESMYYVLEGRGEILAGKGQPKRVVGADTAVYFPAGSTHGIKNVGRKKLVYLSCHAPPYEIEDLYRHWQESDFMTTGG